VIDFHVIQTPSFVNHIDMNVIGKLRYLTVADRNTVVEALIALGHMSLTEATNVLMDVVREQQDVTAIIPNSYIGTFDPEAQITYTAFQQPHSNYLFQRFVRGIKKMWHGKRFSTFLYGGKSEFEYELSLAFGYDPDNNNVYYRVFRSMIIILQAIKRSRILHPGVYLPDGATENHVRCCVAV
jgi:hypothetical protein